MIRQIGKINSLITMIIVIFISGICIFDILVSIILWIFHIRDDRSNVFNVV